jgi:quercetin dioxygenase-like cupin family protein
MRWKASIVIFAVFVFIAAGARVEDSSSAAIFGLQDSTPVATGRTGITSEVLGRGEPARPLQDELALGRVVIEPGAAIPEHEHPGTQLAVIMSGELTYTVLTDDVPVTRASDTVAAGSPVPEEIVTAGNTVILRAGDSVLEQPGAFHRARNAGDEPVVILLATLFASGQPRTIFVGATPTP